MTLLEQITAAVGRPLTEAEQAQAELWIADVRADIAARATAQGTTLAALDPAAVDRVTREAVVARLLRPADGLSQYDVTVDDTRVSRRYTAAPSGFQYAPEWWVWLGLTGGSSGAFEVDTIPPSPAPADGTLGVAIPLPWWSLDGTRWSL